MKALRTSASTSCFSLFGLLGLLILLSAMGSTHSFAATTTYPMQSGIQYSFIQGTQATNSYFDMTVSAWASSSSVIPSHVAVNYWVTVNGTIYYNHGCSLNYNPGQLSNSCSFTVPFKGNGDYWFYATFQDNSGKVVAQAIVDPLIEPEWK